MQSQTVSPTESVDSYSDYSYGTDAGWVEPSPWWWQPAGFFAGYNFVPLTTVVVFNRGFRHPKRFFNDRKERFFDRDQKGRFFNSSEFDARRDGRGREKEFFGLSATTNLSAGAIRRESFGKAVVRTAGRRREVVGRT